MNPVDYWYNTNPSLKKFIDEFWICNNSIIPDLELKNDMEHLFFNCVVFDKLQCLSVLAAIKQIKSK